MEWADAFISFDTETTGLDSKAEILELGVVHYYKGQRVREWSTFFTPQNAKKDDPDVLKAMEINHITWDMLKGAPTFKEVAEQIECEMSELVWVAHNAEFDIRMLDQEFKRLGGYMGFKPKVVACTKALDFYLNPKQKGYKLGDVCERWKVMQSGAHRAIVDAQACGDVFYRMVQTGKLPETMEQADALVKTAEQSWKKRPRGTW